MTLIKFMKSDNKVIINDRVFKVNDIIARNDFLVFDGIKYKIGDILIIRSKNVYMKISGFSGSEVLHKTFRLDCNDDDKIKTIPSSLPVSWIRELGYVHATEEEITEITIKEIIE